MIFSAADFTGYHLGTIPVSYPPKNIYTQALQVLHENIGAIALEMQRELFYNEAGLPYVTFQARRGTDEDPRNPEVLTLRATNWLVVLGDELHVFRDFEFKATFHQVHSTPQHELLEDNSTLLEQDLTAELHGTPLENDFAPGGRGLWSLRAEINPGEASPFEYQEQENVSPGFVPIAGYLEDDTLPE